MSYYNFMQKNFFFLPKWQNEALCVPSLVAVCVRACVYQTVPADLLIYHFMKLVSVMAVTTKYFSTGEWNHKMGFSGK